MIKKISLLLAMVMTFLSCIALSSCGPEQLSDAEQAMEDFVSRLSVRKSDDGDYFVITGLGANENSKIKAMSEYEGKPIMEIGNNAFNEAHAQGQLVEMILPDSIFKIGISSFYSCKKLTKVTLGSGMREIGFGAFQHCDSLTSINLPEGLERIDECAFMGCSALPKFTLPSTLKYIGTSAFTNTKNTGTEAFIHNESVMYMPTSDLKSWVILAYFTVVDADLPDNTVGIASNAFAYCYDMVTLEIPRGVKYINKDAFVGCTSLKTIYYGGSKEEFDNIVIESGNEKLWGAEIIYAN